MIIDIFKIIVLHDKIAVTRIYQLQMVFLLVSKMEGVDPIPSNYRPATAFFPFSL